MTCVDTSITLELETVLLPIRDISKVSVNSLPSWTLLVTPQQLHLPRTLPPQMSPLAAEPRRELTSMLSLTTISALVRGISTDLWTAIASACSICWSRTLSFRSPTLPLLTRPIQHHLVWMLLFQVGVSLCMVMLPTSRWMWLRDSSTILTPRATP